MLSAQRVVMKKAQQAYSFNCHYLMPKRIFMKSMLIALSLFISASCFGEKVSEKDLYGTYSIKNGDTLFEEMFLDSDNHFYSWLRQKPASTGTWSLKGKTIYVKTDGAFEAVEIKIMSLSQKDAEFVFDGSDSPATFSRSEE